MPNSLYNNAIFVDSPDKMPTQPHWAIIKQRYHENGYGQTDMHVSYEAYLKVEDWEAAVQEAATSTYGSTSFRAMHVIPGSVTTKVSVQVKIP